MASIIAAESDLAEDKPPSELSDLLVTLLPTFISDLQIQTDSPHGVILSAGQGHDQLLTISVKKGHDHKIQVPKNTKDPRMMQIWSGLKFEHGNTLFANERFEEAIKVYEELMDQVPLFRPPYFTRHAACQLMGTPNGEGLESANEPERSYRYVDAGLRWIKIGLYPRAIRDFSIAVALSGNNWIAYWNRGVAFSEYNRPDLAIPEYEVALANYEGKENKAKLHANIASAYMNCSGEEKKAKPHLHKALELDPKCWVALCNAGEYAENSGEIEKANEFYQRWIAVDPGSKKAKEKLEKLIKGQQQTP